MIPAVVLALVAVVGGTLASYVYDDDAPLVSRLAYGASSGLVALSAVGFVLANFVDIELAAIAAGVAVALPLAVLVRTGFRQRLVADVRGTGQYLLAAIREPALPTIGPIVYAVLLTVFLWLVFDRVIVEHDGGLFTGYVNNLGDLPFHLDVTSSFAFGQNFPPEDPTFAGTGFAYPYLSDVLAAMFVALGASMREAFFIENLLLGLALVGLIYRFTRVLTADRLAGFIAPVLVLFSGGLGWLLLLQDARTDEGGLFGVLGALTRDYTISGDGPLRWGNAITTLLVTQRSLLLGLPIALIVFTLLWKLIHMDIAGSARVGARTVALAAGILTGSLPLVHAHSFVVVMGTAFLVGLLFRQWREGRWRPWLIYVVSALVIALPQIWWSTHDSIATAGTFFGFELGWDHREENIAWFWFLNTGLFIPLAAAAAFWPVQPRIASRSLLLFTAAFLAWFIVPNVMKLAPWVWDNIKVLFYWFVGFVPVVALLIARLLKSGPGLRAAGATALVMLTVAGGLDVWRVVSGQTEYGEFDRDGIAIAALIREETPPRALMLNAPTWNTPVFLTGRRSLLGYTGHVWSRGLPYTDREADIRRIYAGEADAAQLLDKYGIEYIVVSPIERNNLTVNDAFFERFTKVAEAGEYELYEVARP
ncbi:MAG: hypothetical protein Q7S35_05660 [Candidatus Limnocylindrales bacterium]|nr:hypothetical protein [Candidatus Limnocylindrales bacterium]